MLDSFEIRGYVNEILGIECLLCLHDTNIRTQIGLFPIPTLANQFILTIEKHLEDFHA